MGIRRSVAGWAAALVTCLAAGAALADPLQELRERLPEDEVVYFLLPDRFQNADPSNDRGGLEGDRLKTGFDPTDKAFFHGGDLKGVTARLDYIKGLGATAVWLTPVFRNKAVQGRPGHESAGYHGYWITDFTTIDPHLGTEDDFREFVDAAHQRGMKVYMDIVINHTADVIQYRECPNGGCRYRSKAEYPWTRRGGIEGQPINEGFLGDDAAHQTEENFARLTNPDWAYTPYIPAGEEHVKVPDWLNNPIYYHNRGESTFEGESSLYGDFGGLDDVMTEHPRVVAGFIEIFGSWIDRFGIDGFRIDTARHVNPEFWKAFIPAMRARAAARGIPHFHIFGEAYEGDPGVIARYTRVDGYPAMIDFALAFAIGKAVAEGEGTRALTHVFDADALYEGGAAAARGNATFVSNHDAGRAAWFVRKGRRGDDPKIAASRVRLAYAMLLLLRGMPVVYYGDEQGFVGSGGDQDARQDMFLTQVESYRKEPVLGPVRPDARDHFDTTHPLYRGIAMLAHLRAAEPALRRGRQVVRLDTAKDPGLFVVSRFEPGTDREIVIAFNTSLKAVEAHVEVEAESVRFRDLAGKCAPSASAPGSYHIALPPLGFAVCAVQPAKK